MPIAVVIKAGREVAGGGITIESWVGIVARAKGRAAQRAGDNAVLAQA
ncbi:hypothetical protein OAC41_05995 [Acidimicrobiales bacterium]|nr:hypothetical protein [Acidimicrobiales bacterium]MDC0349724.1 hypothetical protein [bacterium]